MAQLLLLFVVIFGGVMLSSGSGLGTLGAITWVLVTLAGLISLAAVTAVKRRETAGGDAAPTGYCNIHDHRPLGKEGCPMCRTAQEPPSPR